MNAIDFAAVALGSFSLGALAGTLAARIIRKTTRRHERSYR
jgi:NhaP-type Na+/H+ or K+/H+ antiporter